MKYNWFLGTLAILSIAGCSTSNDDLDSFLKDPGVAPHKIETLPTTKQFPGVQYSRDLVNDPFIARFTMGVDTNSQPPVPAEERQPLELFSLDSLKMVGLIKIGGKPYALIRDSEHQVHRVTIGQRIGQNYGKVIQVDKNGVQLKESIQNNVGTWIEVDTTLMYQENDNLSSSR